MELQKADVKALAANLKKKRRKTEGVNVKKLKDGHSV